MTSVTLHTTLESSRTTYFDISQEYGTESGGPLGELKITESTLSYPKPKEAKATGKRKTNYTRIRKGCDFLRRKAETTNELKGINVRKNNRIADRSEIHKTWCFMSGYG